MFEDLPIKLTQQEERVLRAIVAPESDKKRERRRIAIWMTVVVVGMLGGICGLMYVPVGDVSEYKSVADAAYTVLFGVVILGNLYFLFKGIGIQRKLIQKLFEALSPTDESEGGVNPADN